MEIEYEVNLSREEENLLDMHSVLNVLNVVLYELLQLSEIVGEETPLEEAQHAVYSLADTLRDREEALNQIAHVDRFRESVLSAVRTVRRNTTEEEKAEVDAVKDNLESIFSVIEVRAREISARAENPHAWVNHSIQQLEDNFFQVFKAIQLNSKGSYRIVGNIAQYEKDDYFLTLSIDSVQGDHIYMPAVFQDVIRDLIANARKYTPPGGDILAGVYQDEEELRFVVMDSGRGIPEEEVGDAIRFGFRGSNVKDRPTRGGGFGLTKAYYVTKIHNGRMWIENREAGGTRIEIRLPLP